MIKVVRPDRRAEPRVVEALLTEGEIATTLAHPHLVRGYAVHTDPPSVVLETLSGATLAAEIDDGALALPDVAELGLQLTAVLGYLHAHDWLHLDVKPANVVVDHGLGGADRPAAWPPVPATVALAPARAGLSRARAVPRRLASCAPGIERIASSSAGRNGLTSVYFVTSRTTCRVSSAPQAIRADCT